MDGGVDCLVDLSLIAQQVQTAEKPDMGASIGVAGVPKSATLGGYVRELCRARFLVLRMRTR